MTKTLWVILMVQWYLCFHMDPYGSYQVEYSTPMRSTSYLGHHATKAPPVGVVRHLALHLVAWVPWTILDRCRLPTTLKGSLSVKKLLGEPLDLHEINRGYTKYNLHWILHQLFWLRGHFLQGLLWFFRMLEWPCIEVCPFLKQTKVKIVRSKPLRSTSMGFNQQRTLRYPQNQIEPWTIPSSYLLNT